MPPATRSGGGREALASTKLVAAIRWRGQARSAIEEHWRGREPKPASGHTVVEQPPSVFLNAPPEPSSASPAARFVALLNRAQLPAMVPNLETRLAVCRAGGIDLPVTINRRDQAPTCYLCSPSTAYIGYAREELRHFTRHWFLNRALNALVSLGQPVLAASGLDGQVQPNNWLLATNPLPELDREDLVLLTSRLVAEWPELAVIWRSLNDVSDARGLDVFQAAGYELLPARQIYLFDCREGAAQPRVHRDERRDLALLDDGSLELVPHESFSDTDFGRAQLLYQLLYLDKYTWLNPHYTAEFLKAMHQAALLQFHGLRSRSGSLDGVIAFFHSGDVMTAPIVGYDTSQPQALGLYRRLMGVALRRARVKRMLFNMSAGAAGFKRSRGGVAAIEYSAVYARHLGLYQRAAIGSLRAILAGVGVPLLRRFAL